MSPCRLLPDPANVGKIQQDHQRFFRWNNHCGSCEIGIPEARGLRPLEEENSRLKKLMADFMLDNTMPKDMASKNFQRPTRNANL